MLLTAFAKDLAVLDRVPMDPEDEFESHLDDEEEMEKHIGIRYAAEGASRRHRYLLESVVPYRARANVEALHRLYAGQCQVCLYDPRTIYGMQLCHGHHIQWLSRGGEDVLDNMALLCPNHHAAVHRDDAPFDYGAMTFTFTNGRVESLSVNRHLPPALR
jgi:5-methylcytosine-specific restriction protein A